MSWNEILQQKLATSIGQFGVEELFDNIIKNYLFKYNKEELSEPHRLISIYLEVYGYMVIHNKEIKKFLIKSLNKKSLTALAEMLDITIKDVDSLIICSNKILDAEWGITSDKSKIFWNYFDLDDLLDEAKENTKADNYVLDKCKSLNGNSERFYELHSYQSQVRHDIIRNFTEYGLNRVLLQLPTGAGKTRVAVHTVISYLIDIIKNNRHVIWLAYEPLLLDQAADTFEKIWPTLGIGHINIQRMYGKHKDEPVKGEQSICFANVVTLEKKYEQYKKQLNNHVSLIVFDEAHQVIAAKSKKLLENILYNNINVRLLGLTATPGRTYFDEIENKRLVSFFDDTLVNIFIPESGIKVGSLSSLDAEMEKEKSAIKYLQDQKVLAKIEHKIIKAKKVETTKQRSGEVYNTKLLKELESDDERNKLIIDAIVELNGNMKKVVVFACSVNHAQSIVTLLRLENVNAGLVIGENRITRENVLDKFMFTDELNVIVNYEVLTTGFDAPCIDALVITRPTSSVVTYSQILGRALRGTKNGGHDTNYVYNVETSIFGDEVDAYMSFGNYWGN